jgi:hypothetical protein
MTKEITKSIILQEIQDKLKLRDWEASRFLFSESVTPIYDIDQHLKRYVNRFIDVSVTTTGALQFYNVPDDEKWTLHRYDVVFMGAGAYTVAGVYTVRDIYNLANFCYLDLTAAQNVSYHVTLPQPVVLMPLSRIYINIDGFTSTQDLRLYIDYSVEEIR